MGEGATEEKLWHKHYDEGVPKDIQFQDLTVSDIFERAVERWPDRPAVVFMNCRLTFRQLAREVDKTSAALAALGIQNDSRVAVHMPNLPQATVAVLAILRLCAQAVMTNPLYTARELEHQWNDADVHVAITMDFLHETVLKDGLKKKVPVKHYIVTAVPDYLRFPLNWLAPLKLKKQKPARWAKVAPGTGILFWKKVMKAGHPPAKRAQFGTDHLANLQYTGGTTGPAKGVMLTHGNLSCQVQQLASWMPDIRPGREVFLASLPYFHVFGYAVSMLLPIFVGASAIHMPNPRDIPMMMKNITKKRVTLFPGVPALYNALNSFPGIENLDVSSVEVCVSGSAPLPKDTLERFEQLTGAKISEGFGMTECSPCTHCNPLNGLRKIGSIGIPLPGTDSKIVDADDGVTEMPIGEPGEIIMKGPQVMQGYWNRPDATASTVRDGWMYSGDLGVMDEDGFFKIVGRKKDMILASGYNIYPDEIDRLLVSHDAVFEACTIGIPDEKRGETVKSFVVLNPGAKATAEELTKFCEENLARYKIPKTIEFRDDLPKSSMMKLLRRELRDQEVAKMEGSKG